MVNLAGIPKQTGKTTKQTAQDVAKRIAQEQLEFLKSTRQQVSPTTEVPQPQQQNAQPQPSEQENKVLEQRLQAESNRKLEELENEIKKYRIQKEQQYAQKVQSEKPVDQPKIVEAPVTNVKRPRGMMAAMKQKLSSMTSKAEKQRNVSG